MITTPPIAAKKPHTHEAHGQQWEDPYHWLRDPHWPEVEDTAIRDYLEAENAYAEAVMAPHQGMTDALYTELRARIKEEDQSVPIFRKGYFYYERYEEGKPYPIHCRKAHSMQAGEEILLDENLYAEDKSYCNIADLVMDERQMLFAYAVDETGGERFQIQVKSLASKRVLDSAVSDAADHVIWHRIGHGFFYLKMNEQWRADRLYFHMLGRSQESDFCLYHELDPTFHLEIMRSASERYLLMSCSSGTTKELRYLDLTDVEMVPQVIEPRREGHKYSVDHHDTGFFILTNDQGPNFRLAYTAVERPGAEHWHTLIPHDPGVYLTDIDLFKTHLVLSTREKGLPHISVYSLLEGPVFKGSSLEGSLGECTKIPFEEESYVATVDFTHYADTAVRFCYSSLTTPLTILEFHFETGTIKTRKIKEILGGFDASLYETKRITATSGEGNNAVQIPISLVYKKSLMRQDGENPLLLYGYGSYGHAVPPHFRHTILSLLDRGFVYAIAHIRGGDDMGYSWYEDAKFLNKWLTFQDFIVCAEHLIATHYTQKGQIVIHGGSAGGLLLGVALNERPELFKAAIAEVPFVDVLNTMLDDSLPLTPGEYKEWGNPQEKPYFDYIRSYSPYDNVRAQPYPAIFVTAGITDPRVGYWEPAKWVATLRACKTDSNCLLLKTNMDAGHSGPTGRFAYLEEVATLYSFALQRFM